MEWTSSVDESEAAGVEISEVDEQEESEVLEVPEVILPPEIVVAA